MAGNWKMNENHLEAIALVQKLAFTLTDRDFDIVEAAVLPPFTALRSAQTQQVRCCISQLDGSLAGIPAAEVAAMVIADEPVLAIGTGEVATPQDAQEMTAAIRSRSCARTREATPIPRVTAPAAGRR